MDLNRKKKILIIDDEEGVRELLELTTECVVDAEFHHARSGNAAIMLLSRDTDFDLIICDYRMPDGDGGHFFRTLQKKKLLIPFILCSSEDPEDHPEITGPPFFGHVSKPEIRKPLVDLLKKQFPEEETAQLVRVKAASMRRFERLPCPVHIKNSDGQVEFHLAIGSLSDSLEESLEEVYIHRNDVDLLLGEVENQVNRLMQGIPSQVSQAAVLSEDLQELSVNLFRSFGWDEATQNLLRRNANLAVSAIDQTSSLGPYLKLLLDRPGSYQSKHATLLSYLSTSFAKAVGMDDEVSLFTFSLASFLHDLPIAEHYDLTKIKKIESMVGNRTFQSDSEVVTYRKHPASAVDLCKQMKHCPRKVTHIVAFHHERPDGSGFPNGVTQSLFSRESALFIIAEEVCHYLLENPKKFKIEKFLRNRESQFQRQFFKEILGSLIIFFEKNPLNAFG